MLRLATKLRHGDRQNGAAKRETRVFKKNVLPGKVFVCTCPLFYFFPLTPTRISSGSPGAAASVSPATAVCRLRAEAWL